jgi:hypothetical protein
VQHEDGFDRGGNQEYDNLDEKRHACQAVVSSSGIVTSTFGSAR